MQIESRKTREAPLQGTEVAINGERRHEDRRSAIESKGDN